MEKCGVDEMERNFLNETTNEKRKTKQFVFGIFRFHLIVQSKYTEKESHTKVVTAYYYVKSIQPIMHIYGGSIDSVKRIKRNKTREKKKQSEQK